MKGGRHCEGVGWGYFFFFNKGFLHPRDTYLSDYEREKEEVEQKAEEEGEG